MFNDRVELEADDWKELRALTNGSDTPAPVATRARIVMWLAEGRRKKEIAALAGNVLAFSLGIGVGGSGSGDVG